MIIARFIKFPEANPNSSSTNSRVINYATPQEQDVQYNLQSNQNNFIVTLQKGKEKEEK